jgi:hypothetical protein
MGSTVIEVGEIEDVEVGVVDDWGHTQETHFVGIGVWV